HSGVLAKVGPAGGRSEVNVVAATGITRRGGGAVEPATDPPLSLFPAARRDGRPGCPAPAERQASRLSLRNSAAGACGSRRGRYSLRWTRFPPKLHRGKETRHGVQADRGTPLWQG